MASFFPMRGEKGRFYFAAMGGTPIAPISR